MTLRFQSAGWTDTGRVRTHNEDSFLDAPERRLWAVADGMGGHTAGDYASGLIVERLRAIPSEAPDEDYADAIETALWTVNADLIRHAETRRVAIVGATVVLMLAFEEFMAVAWAGDSRAYGYRADRLERISRDHSAVQELVDAGELTEQAARTHPKASAVTRAVGGEPRLALDWKIVRHEGGAQFLLCSDGLTRELDDGDIESVFKKNLDPAQTVNALVRNAVEHGGRDNTTAVVIKILG